MIESARNVGPNGENRQKFFAAKVMPFNIVEENKMLLKRLAIYKRKMQDDDELMDQTM
jgi:hypothetical protein